MTESVTYPPGTSNVIVTPVPGPPGPPGPAGPGIPAESGSAAAPSISFLADVDTGFYNPAPNTLGFATGGAQQMTLGPAGLIALGAGETIFAYSPTALDIVSGSYASPIIAQTPSVRISRVEAIPSAANPIDNTANAALVVTSIGLAGDIMQPCAINAVAQSAANMDVCAINSVARKTAGTGWTAAGYFEGRRDVDTGTLHVLEIRANNNTSTVGTYTPSATPDTTGIWLNAGGLSNSALGLGIGGTGGRAFRVGVAFQVSGPTDIALADYSPAPTSIYMNGAKTYGLNLTGATFSSAAMIVPNNVPIQWQQAGGGTANLRVNSSDQLALAAIGGVALYGPVGFQASVGGAVDTYFDRDAANVLAQRNGATAQTLRIYGNFTNSSNYSRLEITSSTQTSILAGALGTGTPQRLIIGTSALEHLYFRVNGTDRWFMSAAPAGHMFPVAHNSYDIGSAAAAPRNIFVAGAVVNRTKAGTPVDADVNAPTDGMLVVDTVASKIWCRIGGVWKQTVALT